MALARRAATAALATVATVAVLLGSVAAGPMGPAVAARRPGGPRPAAIRLAPARAACPPSPFTPGFTAALTARWPGHPFSVSVHDSRTGCDLSYRPDLRLTTASVLKAEIMAGVLLRAQEAGRELTPWEQDRILPMITESADGPAGELWSSLGGVAGMQAVDRAFGLTETVQAAPWGLTRTSAADRTRLQRQLLLGEYGPLDAHFRAVARSYMLRVIPSQRWGITAGVPAGWAVPLKNGFFPSTCCAWRVNSSGVVERPDGTAYAATILSAGWSTEADGIQAVELISRVIAATLAAPVPPFGSAASFVARQFADLFDRPPTFLEWYVATQAVGADGARAPQVLADLLGSAAIERSDLTVLQLWLVGLGRLPAVATFRWRAWQLRNGRLEATHLADQLASSMGDLSDDAFVDRVRTRALGRRPTLDEHAAAVALLAHGVSRGQLLAGYALSPEARRFHAPEATNDLVSLVLLGRAPNATEPPRPEPLTTLVASVLASPEYARRVA